MKMNDGVQEKACNQEQQTNWIERKKKQIQIEHAYIYTSNIYYDLKFLWSPRFFVVRIKKMHFIACCIVWTQLSETIFLLFFRLFSIRIHTCLHIWTYEILKVMLISSPIVNISFSTLKYWQEHSLHRRFGPPPIHSVWRLRVVSWSHDVRTDNIIFFRWNFNNSNRLAI